MSKIKAHEFVTLDGVFEDPQWTAPFGFPPELGAAVSTLTASCSAILLGRRTFEMFAPAWAGRLPEDDPGAPFFNDTTKYVVSSTLMSVEQWQNSEIIGGYEPGVLRDLRDRLEGDMYVSGSGTLVRALLADGLLDELHLFVYPVILGTGARLLSEASAPSELALIGHETFGNGVLHLTYGLSRCG